MFTKMYIITVSIQCPDKKGIISDVTSFIYKMMGNILYIDQYVDRKNKAFFMRLEAEFDKKHNSYNDFIEAFSNGPCKKFKISWKHRLNSVKQKMAIFVSKHDHCLYDLLGRYKSGELDVEIPFIVSNHIKAKKIADTFKVDFYHTPVDFHSKDSSEKKQLELLIKHDIDFVVLARYMQIIPEKIIEKFKNKIINIHHSFLPAFPGAKPYHSAFERGVKIIGATSHYVTKELDAGPIIEQGVTQVTHSHSVDELVSKGKDLEKIVLSNAVKNHIKQKVMVYKNKTVIFN